MSWLKPLTQRIENTFSRKTKRRVNRQSQAAEFKAPRWLANRVEGLEDRALLATFYVDSTPTINGPGADEFTPAAGSHTTVSGLTRGVDLFTTIGGAIAAAAANGTPGDIILVADGTYNEGNNINENLTIRGNQFGVDARSGRSGSNETVISFAGGAFGVHSNNVTLDGLVIQDQTNSNAAPGFGYALYLAPSYTGASIKNNILQNNIVGLALSNTGASQTVIEKNLFQNNTNSGPAGGHSIYSDQFVAGGAVSNVLIDSNKFTNSSTVVNSWALGISNLGATPFADITFSNNEVTNHGRGMYFYNTDGATISNNTISGTTNYGIGLFGYSSYGSLPANTDFTISGNTLSNNFRGLYVVDDLPGDAYTGGTLTLSGGSYTTTGVQTSINNRSTTSIDATGQTFNTVAASAATTAQQYTIVDTIVDAVDVSGFGLVRTKSGNVYVTPNSFLSPATTADIQRAVNAATSGDTVNIAAGSYTGNVNAATPTKNLNLSPGSSPGQVTISGDLTLNAGDTLTIELNGTTAGTGYDQFVVNGVVTLGGATLAASRLTSFVPNNGAQFVLIDNDAAEAPGTFAGLAEGATVTLSNIPFTISYLGTDAATGNDVVLTIVTPTSVYVDDSWAGTSVGTTPANSSPANLVFGYNAFDTIQAAIDRVATNGTVTVYGGTYAGTVNVNKNLQPIVAATNSGIPGETTVAINGAVTLDETDNSTTFTQNGSTNLTFGSSIIGAGGDETLTVNGSNTLTFSGTVSSLASLVTDALGTTQINTSSITTSGNQSYGDNVVVQVDSTLSTGTGAGDITFSETVNASASGVDLGLTAGSGNIGFTGAVGASAPTLNSLTINTANNVTFSSTLATAANFTQSAGTGTTTLPTSTIGTTLSITTNTINNTATANVSVTNNASFNAASITLGTGGSDTMNFGSVTFVSTAGDVSISENSDMVITGTNSVSTNNNLNLTSTGTITDAASTSLNVAGSGGAASFNATSITLGDDVGDMTNFGTLTVTSGGAVTITEDSNTVFAGASTAGSLTINSAGTISDGSAGDINVSGAASFTAATTITLGDSASNDIFFGSVSLSGTTVDVTEDDAAQLDSVTATALTYSANGAITDNGNLSVTNNASFTGASITLGSAGETTNFGSLTTNTSASNGNQDISEDSGLTAISLNAGSGNIILNSAGTITDGDAGNDATAATLSVTITNGNFGATGGGDNSIDTSVANLNVDTSANNGSQWIDEASGLSTINLQAGSGNVTLVAGSTVIDGDANNDITATTATVTITNGNFGATGGGDNSIDTSVTNLNVDTATNNGSQWIDEASGLSTINLQAGSGNVTLLAGSTVVDGDANNDITATTATVTVTNGNFGATGGGNNSIDTSVTNLNVDTATNNGSQWIDEASGLSTINLQAGSGNVTLVAGGSVADSDGSNDITATSTAVTAVGGIGSATAIQSAVTNLAFANTTSGNVQFVNTGALTIASFGGVTTSSNAGTGTISVQANSPLTVSVAVSGPSDILLQAGDSAVNDDDLTISASVTSTGGGVIELIAGDDIIQNGGTITSTAGVGARRVELTADNEGAGGDTDRGGITQSAGNIVATNLVVRSYDAVALGTVATNNVTNLAASVTNGDAALDYEDADSVNIESVDGVNGITTAGGDVLVDATSGTITVNQAIDTTGGTGTGGISVTGAVVLNATLDADGGDITLNGNNTAEADLDINANLISSESMTLSALRDIFIGALVQTTGSGSDITITADSNNSTVGGVRVEAAGQVDSADQVSISGSDLNVTGGATDSVEVEADGTNAQVQGAGAISISSGAAAPNAADIFINGLINGTSTATVTITADHDVTFAATGDVTTNNGFITVTADNATGGNTGGVITMADGTVFTAGTNSTTTLTADGNVTLGAVNSGSGFVKVTSTSGAILDADAGAGVDITAGTAALRAETGVGSDADAIETTFGGAATTLTLAAETDSGDIHLSNSGSFTIGTVDSLVGVTILDTINNNSGNDHITLMAAGPLTADSSVANSDGGNVTLTANGALSAPAPAMPTTYDLLNGELGGDVPNFFDDTYTGTGSKTTPLAALSGGLGDLTDGVVATTNWNGQYLRYVGWHTIDPIINFHFATAVTLTNVRFYFDDAEFGGVDNPSGVTISNGVDSAFVAVPDPVGTAPFVFDFSNPGITGSDIDIQLHRNNPPRWVMVSEIEFTAADSMPDLGDLTVNATVTASGGNGEVELNAADDIIQNANGDISAAGTGVLDYNAGTGTADGVITQANGATAVTATGLITMDADGDITLANVQTGNNTTAAVTINTTAGGVLDGGDTDVDVIATSGRLTINAATGIGSAANGLETTVDSLDLDNATSGNIQINETNGVTVVDAQQATAGNISIVAGGTITVDDLTGSAVTVISTVGSGTISLDANGNNSDIVLNDGIQSVNGNITLTADNDVSAAADGDIASTSGNLQVTADVNSTNVSTIFMNGGALWNAGSGTIDLDSDGSITLGGLSTTNATLTAVTIDTTVGAVADGGNTFVNIVANSGRVVINAATGVGSGDALETTIDSLDVDNSTSGNIEINETDAITVFDAQEATAGNILITAGGTITVDNGGAVTNAISTVGAGTISLDANGAASDIVINDGIQSASGNITLTADNDVTTDAEGDISSTSGDLTVTADVFAGNNGGAITMANGALWNAGSGLIDLDADGNITLGGLLTTSSSTSAVTIDSTSAGVVDGGDTHVDIVANNVTARTTINAVTGVGSTNDIETTIANLVLNNTGSGNVDLDETDAIVVREIDQDAASGTVTLTASGTITIEDVQSGISSLAGAIVVDANGTSSDVVNNDSIVSTSGPITVTADDDITFDATSDLTSTSGNVSITADADNGGTSSGAITMADGSFVNAGTGTITAAADGNITLSRFVTTNNTSAAVSITSIEGGLIDGGDTNTDNIEATSVNAVVTITTATGIGHAAPVGGAASHAIETEIATLNASVTGAGGIDINELNAIVLVDVDTANGAITVDAGGTITATDVQSMTDSDANDIILDSGADIVVTSIHAGTADGDVLLDAAGSITESAANTTTKITADGLRLLTGSGGVATETGTVGTAQATTLLDTSVNTLEASIASSGLFLVNTQALTLIDQNLLVAGNDGLDRDNDGGTTAITSTSGTVRVNTTAGLLTISELVNATGQLASFNAVGIRSNGDGASSSSDVNAASIAFRSTNGIGTSGDELEVNATSALAFFNETAGDVYVRDVAGGLVIDDVDSLTESENETGVVTITALSPLTVAHDVTASGDILMTATDSAAAGDNLTVNTLVTVESTGANVTLRAGDNLFLIDSSNVIADSGLVTLLGDFWTGTDPDVGTGSLMNLFGTISSGSQAVVNGHDDDDFINLNPGVGHFATSILLDGQEGSDTYTVQFGRLLAPSAVSVDVEDSGTGDDDVLTTNGTSDPEEVNIFNSDGDDGSDLAGGFVQITANLSPLSASEQVNYTGSLERLIVNGQDGNEFFHVRPSQTTRIRINGGNTNFGPGLTDNPFIADPEILGDVLDLQTLDNTFNFIGTTFFVDGGSPADFKGITIRNLEYVPLIPTGTADPLRFDFDGSVGSPATQAGYTTVAPGRTYGSGTLNADYGWVGTAANFLDRGDVLSSSYENLLQDAHFDTVQRTFRVDVSDLVADGDAPQADGWYLVSLTFGDANSARSGVQVRNADNAGYLLLTTPNTVAGQFYTATLVVQVFDGTIDLQFQSATADPRWQVNGMEIQPGEILTFGSPDPGPLVADGLTEDTFFGYEAEIGALITVRPGIDTSGDEIPDADLVVTSPDMDPDLEGVQRLVGPDGLFSYTIRRPSVAGSAFVSFQATHPTLVTETGSLAIDYVLPEIRRYDFNSDSSPTQAPVATPGFPSGYVGVVPTDLKTPTNGYGWVTSPSALDRGAGLGDAQANLRRDGAAGTSTRTFQTQLDPGTYFVNVTLGDKNAAHDNMQVTANGTLMLPDVDTGLGQFFHSMFQVATTGTGLISFEFTDAGGSDPTWVANGLEIRAGSQVNQATVFVSNNSGSQPADGGTIDTITVTFPNTIAAGTLLTVTSSLGTIVSSDSSSEYLGTQVLGTGLNTVVFQVQRGSAGGTPTFTLTAVDGSAFASLSNSTSLQYTAPQSRRFDFNAPGGPTQTPTNPPTGTGYQGVAPTVLYSAAQGYGWVSTSPSSFDRGVATGTSISDFVRDGASSNSSTRDFRIDNLGNNTSYSVTVTMGDLSVAHDLMSVSVITGSGTGASGITTAAGAVTQRTFTATSNASGTLVFRFGDADMLTDGADTGWVVNGLELYANPAVIAVPSGGPLAADGTNADMLTIGGLVSGQVYTVTTSTGTLVQGNTAPGSNTAMADADSVFTGTQFTATGATANLFLKRPATAGVATITVTQLNGASSGTGTQTYTAPLSTRYDFNAIAGHGVTPNDTQAGFIGVAGNKLYSSGDGYGFLTTVDDASRGQATVTTRASKALYQDFVRGTSAGTFQLSVPVNQVYNLRFYSGDTAFAHDLLRITIEDGAAAGYAKTAAATPKNAFTTVIFNNIEDLNNDGILKIVFSDLTVSGSGTSTYEPFRWVVNGFDIWQVGATDPGQAPLTSESATTGGSDAGLTNAALAPIVREAIARWSATGLTAAEVALLKAITFQVTDLDAQHHLGLASEAEGKIQLDDNANGHGWFVDRTPRDNREFSRRGLSSELTARPNGPAAGHMDLLTVVMHEMGHFLGREHSANPQSLMAEDLSTGVRRLPVRETLPLSRSVLELGSSPRGSQVTAPAPNLSQAAALTSKLSKTPLTTANNVAAVNDRKRHETRDRVFADLKKFFAELETLNDR